MTLSIFCSDFFLKNPAILSQASISSERVYKKNMCHSCFNGSIISKQSESGRFIVASKHASKQQKNLFLFSSLKLMGIRFGAIVAHCMLHLNVKTILFHHKYLEQYDICAMEFSIRVFNSKCILWKYVIFFLFSILLLWFCDDFIFCHIFWSIFDIQKETRGFFSRITE